LSQSEGVAARSKMCRRTERILRGAVAAAVDEDPDADVDAEAG
jgi:hypothetical protein